MVGLIDDVDTEEVEVEVDGVVSGVVGGVVDWSTVSCTVVDTTVSVEDVVLPPESHEASSTDPAASTDAAAHVIDRGVIGRTVRRVRQRCNGDNSPLHMNTD